MANKKISGFDTLAEAEISLNEVAGIAAYYDDSGTLANVQFSGQDIAELIPATPSLDAVMTVGATYSGVNAVSVSTSGAVAITSGDGDLNGLSLLNSGNGTNGITMTYNPNIGASGQQLISLAPGSDGKISLNAPAGQLIFDSSVSLFSTSGSDLELKVNDNADNLKIYLGTSGPSVGDVLAVKSLDGNTGVMGWETPSSSTTSFTNLTAGDVVKWDYLVDGPNIELITTQDPNPAITLDNVITMWDSSTDTQSDITSIPDGATGTLIVHPTANPYFNFPTGSKIADASNIRTDGSIKVLRWIKEGNGSDPTLDPTAAGYGCLYWAGFDVFTTAATIPGPDVDPAVGNNLYGWWDPNEYTASVLGDDGSSLGVVNNSTLASKNIGGASTGNSLTIDNEETTADEAYEHIEWVNLGGSNYSFDFKPTGTANFLFSNDTVNPTNNRYTIMVWFRSDFSTDSTDLGLFNASVTGSSSDVTLASGIRIDDATSATSRRLEYRGRDSNNYESKYQNWANNDWTCLIMAFDPLKDDGAGGTYAEIRHLMGNEYTEENAGETVEGSGIVSDGDEITINADGTYIDFLYDGGDLNDPSNGNDPASDLVASDIIEQFTGFQFARTAAPYFSSFDWNGEIGLCCLWDGEAKSDADMQTIYDYSKDKFGL